MIAVGTKKRRATRAVRSARLGRSPRWPTARRRARAARARPSSGARRRRASRARRPTSAAKLAWGGCLTEGTLIQSTSRLGAGAPPFHEVDGRDRHDGHRRADVVRPRERSGVDRIARVDGAARTANGGSPVAAGEASSTSACRLVDVASFGRCDPGTAGNVSPRSDVRLKRDAPGPRPACGRSSLYTPTRPCAAAKEIIA